MIYIVYSNGRKEIHIYEFFNCKKDAELYIKTHDYKDFLDIFYFHKRVSRTANFIKGFYREILVIDEQLSNYFSGILEYHLLFRKDKDIQTMFNIKILKAVIGEIDSRLLKDDVN
jgi:hypothetical protein